MKIRLVEISWKSV